MPQLELFVEKEIEDRRGEVLKTNDPVCAQEVSDNIDAAWLKELAEEFKTCEEAIEAQGDAAAIEAQGVWSICCYKSTNRLIPFLARYGILAAKCHGHFIANDGSAHDHWWAIVGDNIVDTTAGQFYPKDDTTHRIVVTETCDPRYRRKDRP